MSEFSGFGSSDLNSRFSSRRPGQNNNHTTLVETVEKLDRENKTLSQERDQALEDLSNVESAFSELHKRYERAKVTLESLKKNEELLKTRDALMVKKVDEKDQQLKHLRQEVQDKLEKMFRDYEAKGSDSSTELSRLKAVSRKNELKIATLEHDLEQKVKENAQLNALCDDLINGKGGG